MQLKLEKVFGLAVRKLIINVKGLTSLNYCSFLVIYHAIGLATLNYVSRGSRGKEFVNPLEKKIMIFGILPFTF